MSQSVVAQQPIQPLQPISGWTLEFGDAYCALRSAFGSEEEPVILELRQFSTGYDVDITVVGEGLSSNSKSVEYVFSPGSEWRGSKMATQIRTTNGEEGVRFRADLLTMEDDTLGYNSYLRDAVYRDREAAISTIGIRNALDDELYLAIGPLDEAMEVMRDCTDDLMTQWGLDPDLHQTITTPARPDSLTRWSRQIIQDYPTAMLRAGEDGSVTLSVVVGLEGKVVRCIVTASNAHVGLQEGACQGLLRYARFEPARNADGEPMHDIWSTTVVYSIN